MNPIKKVFPEPLLTVLAPAGEAKPLRLVYLGMLTLATALFVVWALRGFAAAVRGAVFDSSLEYLDPKVLFPPLDVALMMLNLIIIGLALTVLGTGAVRFFLLRLSAAGGRHADEVAWAILGSAFAGGAILFGLIEQTPLMSVAYRFAFGAGLLSLAYYRSSGIRAGRRSLTRDEFLLAILFASALLPPVWRTMSPTGTAGRSN